MLGWGISIVVIRVCASRTYRLYVFDGDMKAKVNVRRCGTNGLERETVVIILRVLNPENSFIKMLMRAGEFIRSQEVPNVRLQASEVDCPCVTRWLPFYLDDNMRAE